MMLPMDKYISAHDSGCSWYFDDPKVNQEDFEQIHFLTEEFSAKLWDENISKSERHLAYHFAKSIKGQAQDWLDTLERLDLNWVSDWNNDIIVNLSSILNNRFQVDDDEGVLFFTMKEVGFETTWGVFLRNWINFLYEDEAPVLLIRRLNIVVVFRPMGAVLVGKYRRLPATDCAPYFWR